MKQLRLCLSSSSRKYQKKAFFFPDLGNQALFLDSLCCSLFTPLVTPLDSTQNNPTPDPLLVSSHNISHLDPLIPTNPILMAMTCSLLYGTRCQTVSNLHIFEICEIYWLIVRHVFGVLRLILLNIFSLDSRQEPNPPFCIKEGWNLPHQQFPSKVYC